MKKRICLTALFLIFSMFITACSAEEDSFSQIQFDFHYRLAEQEYRKGDRVEIEVDIINASDRAYVFTGTSSDFYASAKLYCMADGSEYAIPMKTLGLTSPVMPYRVVIDPGAGQTRICTFHIPDDAPSGQYHLRVSYKNAEETFYNVFALSEEG